MYYAQHFTDGGLHETRSRKPILCRQMGRSDICTETRSWRGAERLTLRPRPYYAVLWFVSCNAIHQGNAGDYRGSGWIRFDTDPGWFVVGDSYPRHNICVFSNAWNDINDMRGDMALKCPECGTVTPRTTAYKAPSVKRSVVSVQNLEYSCIWHWRVWIDNHETPAPMDRNQTKSQPPVKQQQTLNRYGSASKTVKPSADSCLIRKKRPHNPVEYRIFNLPRLAWAGEWECMSTGAWNAWVLCTILTQEALLHENYRTI